MNNEQIKALIPFVKEIIGTMKYQIGDKVGEYYDLSKFPDEGDDGPFADYEPSFDSLMDDFETCVFKSLYDSDIVDKAIIQAFYTACGGQGDIPEDLLN